MLDDGSSIYISGHCSFSEIDSLYFVCYFSMMNIALAQIFPVVIVRDRVLSQICVTHARYNKGEVAAR